MCGGGKMVAKMKEVVKIGFGFYFTAHCKISINILCMFNQNPKSFSDYKLYKYNWKSGRRDVS
jgi:hypothetical protein